MPVIIIVALVVELKPYFQRMDLNVYEYNHYFSSAFTELPEPCWDPLVYTNTPPLLTGTQRTSIVLTLL